MGKESGNGIICVPDEGTAHQVADAVATLAEAYGTNLRMSFSMAMEVMTDKEQRKHSGQTGCLIREIDADGPAEKAGVQENDILHTVNGQPCSLQTFRAAVSDATEKPQGGVVRAEIFRKNGPLMIDLLYPHFEVPAAQLRQQIAGIDRHDAAPAATAPAPGAAVATPPDSVHLDFHVRPVIAEDMKPLALTNSKGLLVVSVENGSLADTMGMQAGDVILQLNGAEIGDIHQFAQTVRSGAAKNFMVWRKGQTLELVVPLSM